MIDFNTTLMNENILLRPMQKGDQDEYFKVSSLKPLWIYFSSDLSVKSECDEWVDTALRSKERKERLPFTIIDRSSNKVIGSSSFGNISYYDGRVEIGWTWLAKECQGKGFNHQLKYLMLKYGFETLNMERIEFKTDVLNVAARRALKKIGCVEEGVLRSRAIMTNDRRRDTIFYSILKSEWPGVKQKNKWD